LKHSFFEIGLLFKQFLAKNILEIGRDFHSKKILFNAFSLEDRLRFQTQH